jgi:predicted nucleic acid-binding protein
METDAKLHIQDLIRSGEIELAWSFVLDYENGANPFEEVRDRIAVWKKIAVVDCGYSETIRQEALELMKLGLRQKDAAHVACAISAGVEFFLTTDKKILNKPIARIAVVNPIDFIRRFSDDE